MSKIEKEIENQLQEIASEQEVVIRGKAFKIAREIIPFDKLMEMSTMLAKSTIIPVTYQNRPENVFIACDMASRMGISPMLLMQNLHIIQGKPSMSGQFIGALLKSYPRFSNLKLNYKGVANTDNWACFVTAHDNTTDEELKGAEVSIKMAKAEGWYQKSGSKWQTMPELMLAYRAYAFFGRQHAPELLAGLYTTDEIEDSTPIVTVDDPFVEV